MNLTYGTKQVMHRIRVKLYPNYLPGGVGTFLTRTDSEACLKVLCTFKQASLSVRVRKVPSPPGR